MGQFMDKQKKFLRRKKVDKKGVGEEEENKKKREKWTKQVERVGLKNIKNKIKALYRARWDINTVDCSCPRASRGLFYPAR